MESNTVGLLVVSTADEGFLRMICEILLAMWVTFRFGLCRNVCFSTSSF